MIQFPETISFLYHSIKRRWVGRKSSASNRSNTKIVGKINSIKGHEDIQRLNLLMSEKAANNQQPVMSSLTVEGKENYMAATITLSEILSRTITRIDVMESTLQRNCKNCEKYEKIAM